MDLTVKYLGLTLNNPVIASSSPLTATVEKIVELEKAGIGAVVLKSIFEEQIIGQTASMEQYSNYPEAADYLKTYLSSDYLQSYIKLIRDAKSATKLPIIASINCASSGKWIEYAHRIADAGADAIELNIFFLPTDAAQTSAEIEERYLNIIRNVAETVAIPVSVKLSSKFTNVLHIAQEAYYRKAKGVVMYNRFLEPDIDITRMEYVPASGISSPSELYDSLRNVAIASAVLPNLDITVSTGVHSGEDAVKCLLAGAKAVQVCSTVLLNGLGVIGDITSFIANWMSDNNFERVSDFCGMMNSKMKIGDSNLERVQFMKYYPTRA